MVERHAIGDARAAIVTGHRETRESLRSHQAHHVERRRDRMPHQVRFRKAVQEQERLTAAAAAYEDRRFADVDLC